MTKENNPRVNAVWTLERLHDLFSKYLIFYDDRAHPGLGMTPKQAYLRGMERAGDRFNRTIPYDDNFIMMTFPSTRKGTARVQPGAGVKINYIYYWSDEMRNPKMELQEVPVRFDPFNLAVAYAYLNGRWARCVSCHPEAFEGRSQKELLLATTKLRQLNRNIARNRVVTGPVLAEFFEAAHAEERLRKQMLKDAARTRMHAKSRIAADGASDFSI